VLFYIALWLTIFWRYPDGLANNALANHYFHFSIIFIFWLLSFLSFHLFEREGYRRYTTLFFSLISATTFNLLIAIGYFYFQPELILTPRRFLLVNIALSFVLVLAWGLILKWFVFSRFTQPVYLFSFNHELKNLEDEIKNHNYLGFEVKGHLTEDELKGLRTGSIVIFPDNLHSNPSLANTIFDLRNKDISFYNHNTFYEQLLRRIYLPSLNEIWFLQNIRYSRKILYSIFKELFDLVLGFILFLVFVITFPIVALLIKLTSKGPIMFTQNRVGLDGKVFGIYKYRTMIVGEHENVWTKPNDPRITGFGKFLRKTRLDIYCLAI
jgi:hypothetical protein